MRMKKASQRFDELDKINKEIGEMKKAIRNIKTILTGVGDLLYQK